MMFAEKLCQLCKTNEAELVCFCKKVVLCSSCIGRHLISDPSSMHKPVPLSQSQLTSVLAVNYEKVKAEESQILATLSQKHNIYMAIQEKFEKELKIIDDFQNLSIQFITEFVKLIEADLLAASEEITKRIITQCGLVKSKMHVELDEIKKANFNFDEVTRYLSEFSSIEQVEGFELITKEIDFTDLNIRSLIEKNFLFDIKYNDIGIGEKTPESPLLPKTNKKYHISLSISENDNENPAISATQTPVSKIGKIASSGGSKTPMAKIDKTSRFPIKRLNQNIKAVTTLPTFDSPEEADYGSYTERSSTNTSLNASFSDFSSHRNRVAAHRLKAAKADFKTVTAAKIRLPALLYCLVPEVQAVATYNPATDEVEKLPIPKREACLEGVGWVLASNNMLYCTGGFQSTAKKTTWIYNVSTSDISLGPPMKIGRYNHSTLCLNDTIYVFGGQGNGSLRECEKLNLTDKVWQILGNLNIPRVAPAACVYKGYIYIAGGQGTDSIEKYFASNNTFTMLKIRLPIVGRCLIASTHDQIIIFQNRQATFIDPVKGAIKDTAELPEDDYWNPGNTLVLGRNVYFSKNYVAFRFDLDEKVLYPLAELHRKLN